MAKGENVKFDLNKVRNIGIIAHIDAGKATTTEAVLYHTGKTHRIGSIDEGDTQMDWMVQERERGITIQSAATTAFWKLDDVTYRVNIIDTPGHVDFTAEVERSLRVLDGAVVIFDGKMGVEPQSETVWRQADKYQVPRICFVNKLNLVGASFDEALTSIRERLSPRAFPVHLPLGFEKGTNGLVDIVERKAFTYDPTVKDEELTEVEIPQDLKDKIEKLRVELIEAIADFDDTFMEKYLNGEDLSNEEIWETMRKATMSGTFFPVSGGDSKKGNVVPKILDLVVRLLHRRLTVARSLRMTPRIRKKKLLSMPAKTNRLRDLCSSYRLIRTLETLPTCESIREYCARAPMCSMSSVVQKSVWVVSF